MSPDGRHLVFQAITGGKTQLWLRTLALDASRPLAETENGSAPFWSADSQTVGFFADGKMEGERLFDAVSAASFVQPDRLLFVRQGTLLSQRFDMQTMKPIEDPVPLAEQIPFGVGSVGAAAFTNSLAGSVAYRNSVMTTRQLVWFDRTRPSTFSHQCRH